MREAVAAGQPVIVGLVPERERALRGVLGADAEHVHFVDMLALAGNPARIIPALRDFVDEQGAGGQPVRALGEPVWPGRRPVEATESALHEALLNVAVEPDTPLWLRCCYDVERLDGTVVEEVDRSHPVLVAEDDLRGSTRYGGTAEVAALFAAELPEPTLPAAELLFVGDDLPEVRSLVLDRGSALGIGPERVDDLALAVHEIATNSVHHGLGRGALRVWRDADALVCEVQDEGEITDPLVGRRAPALDGEGGRGVWLANQLCDLVQVRSSSVGTTVRIHTWLDRLGA